MCTAAFFNNNHFEHNTTLQCSKSSIPLADSNHSQSGPEGCCQATKHSRRITWTGVHRKSSGFWGFGSHTLQLVRAVLNNDSTMALWSQSVMEYVNIYIMDEFILVQTWLSYLIIAKVLVTYATNSFTVEIITVRSNYLLCDTCYPSVNLVYRIIFNLWISYCNGAQLF